MKRLLLSAAVVFMMAVSAYAGDYLTNTNQSVRFLRNPSRTGAIGIDGVYYNPAGVVFMNDGWHIQFNWQSPHQTRNVYANYGPLFGANYLNPGVPEEDGSFGRKFKGKADVLIQPSLFAAYNTGNWSFQFGFGVVGGGGECKFKDGISSFEALTGQMGMSALGAGFGGYSLSSNISGKSFFYGITLAAARKVTDRLSLSIGLKGLLASTHYKGSVSDITFRTKLGDIVPVDQSYLLDCKQNAFSLAPIVGVDYMVSDYLNLSAKYEFKNRVKLKSKANNNEAFNTLAATQPSFAAFIDKARSNSDIPASLSFGAQVTPVKNLRLNAGYNHYFDLDTKQWTSDQLSDTDEITFGVEYDVTERITASAGIQKTFYTQKDANYSDISFIMDCFSVGLGVEVAVSEKVKLNAAYFTSNYRSHTKPQAVGYTKYTRTNSVFGVGVDISF